MRRALLIASLLLAPIQAHAETTDFLGNIWPEECADLSDVQIPIKETSPEHLRTLAGAHAKEGATLYGVFDAKHWQILIAPNMPEPLRSYVVKHELCHAKFYKVVGFPNWHKAFVRNK